MVKVELDFGNKVQVSEIKYRVLQEELDNLNNEDPMDRNQVKINKSYIMKKNNCIEVGFFIRNSSVDAVVFEKMELALQNKNNEIIAIKEFEFKEYEPISAMSAQPYVMEFEHMENYDENEEYNIKFMNIESLNSIKGVTTIVDGISNYLEYDIEREVENFVKNLSVLEDGEMDITPFKILKDDKDLKIILLVRNGYSQNVKLNKVPVTLIYEDRIMAKREFNVPDDISIIESRLSKLLTVKFPLSEIAINDTDIRNLEVIIR